MSETIEAVIVSKLGELGPAGVLAMEEFVNKTKTAKGQLADSTMPTGSGTDQVQTAALPVLLEVPGSPVAISGAKSISLSQISEVPTAFGGLRSVVSKGVGAATSAKLGNKISNDHERGFGDGTQTQGTREITYCFAVFGFLFFFWKDNT